MTDDRRYEWDERKRQANLAKHGVDFADIARMDRRRAVIGPDLRADYGEERFLLFAPIDGRLHAAVIVHRGSALRIISLRKANAREVRAHDRQD